MTMLFSPATLGTLTLQNPIVMAPMTRSRATGNVANALMLEYYGARSSAGLIITEGTSPSPDGLGYPRIPGIFSGAQIEGWKPITEAVHQRDGKIFMQLMHCGRIAHPLNMAEGAEIIAPSAVAAQGTMYTDTDGLQPYPVPRAMSEEDIAIAKAGYVDASLHAMEAGFDGVELHGANGYLLEQFFRPNTNLRTDCYGGSVENRARFMLEVLNEVIAAVGDQRVGIRLSPFGVFNDMPLYEAMEEEYRWLAGAIARAAPVYIHLVDHSSMGAPTVPDSIKESFRKRFKGTLILSGGYDAARAARDLNARKCDLVAVGRAFIANPDLVERWQAGASLNTPDPDTFYSAGPKGYIDYPILEG